MAIVRVTYRMNAIDIMANTNRQRSSHILWYIHMNEKFPKGYRAMETVAVFYLLHAFERFIHSFDPMCVVNFIDSMSTALSTAVRVVISCCPTLPPVGTWKLCETAYRVCAQQQYNRMSNDSHLRWRRHWRRRRRQWMIGNVCSMFGKDQIAE